MRIALIGDGESPHLLKWARALAASPGVALWVASSRGFLPAFDTVVPAERRLALGKASRHAGGNVQLLAALPQLGAWLRGVDADWLHAHYLTSHGTLACLAKRLWRLRARIAGSAWGSDILMTPQRSWLYRHLTRWVLRCCAITTSDSVHMADRMRALGAREVMTFPFGLEAMPEQGTSKSPWACYANRGLEPLYQPQRVLETFAALVRVQPEARLVVANDGALRPALERQAADLGLADHVRFVGRLSADAQREQYQRAQWYFSLPQSDSVSVSVLEAMAHGCIPVLSDLPANRELVRSGDNGWVLDDAAVLWHEDMLALLTRAPRIAADNRAWIAAHGLFAPAVQGFLARLRAIDHP